MQAKNPMRRRSRTIVDDVVFTIALSVYAVSLAALLGFAFVEGLDLPDAAGAQQERSL